MIIQVTTATGQKVYVFIWNYLGQIFNTVTLAFETFNPANWANYAVVCTEQAPNGNYFANVPATILGVPGPYTFAGYMEIGSGPAIGDELFTPGSFTIAGASSSALIYSLRALAQDLTDSKTVWSETMGAADQPAFPVDGKNTFFRLRKAPLADAAGVPSYIWYTIVGENPQTRSQVGLTVMDPVNGIVQLVPAPNPGGSAPNGVYFDYNYTWFSDAKYTEFLARAANMTIAGTTDPTTIPEGLLEAMLQYGLNQVFTSLASVYATQYQSSGGEASQQVQSVSSAFRSLAKDAKATADKLRDDYYKRQGQQLAPAWGNLTAYPPPCFDKITPRR